MSNNEKDSESPQDISRMREFIQKPSSSPAIGSEICSRCGKHHWSFKLLSYSYVAAECTHCKFRRFFDCADGDDE